MAKNNSSSSDGGCLWLILIFFFCLYTCENRKRIKELEKKVNDKEVLSNCSES